MPCASNAGSRAEANFRQGLRQLLTETGYGGYVTIEQERDPRNAGGVLADLAASRDFLRRTGF
jgi:inosose dehydratase